ncbi:fungal-specific transcription factor domain-containing protein [Pseudoneurospora amorphoporcata]|uniref:Fungal-specific transcription factor domain-containing protein n=1 Tax=Pseudoneurospora amorphoporcata TaxID=241081 RepID=A0AAN6NMI5_9PEZI|nr:fungal-specific transcription factor domain-containing protein [Pseudoneurospora amorphoporcata]
MSDFGYDSDSVSPPESSEVDYQFPPTPDLHHGTSSWNAPSPTPSYPLVSPSESLFTLPDLGHVQELAEDAEDGDGYVAEPWTNQTAVSTVSRPTSYYPDLAMIAPCPVTSPLFEFHSPAFSEFTDRPNRRALVDHFCNILSHLIVFREESGNPFQQLVLPLTRQSSPVLNAIFALASAHLEYRGVQNDERSLFFHNRAIQGLGRLIEQNAKSNRNEILATIMLLIYYEVLVQRGRSNLVDGHLKGALTIMCTNPEPSDSTSIFLERAFRFYDVIAALSNGRAPLSAAPTAGCLMPFPPLGAPIASPLSNVDTLLGMATTLWPIIHRLSGLVTLKTDLQAATWSNASASKIAVLRTELESTTQAIEAALSRWQPQLPPGLVPDEHGEISESRNQPVDVMSPTMAERSRLHSIWHNALAYRHSAFVYLYRSVQRYSRSHRAVQEHTHRSLLHCAATVKHEGPMGALLWPLFVAACEAVDAEDRDLAEQAFEKVRKRQGMRNIERAWEIVREVWRRADEAGAGVENSSTEGKEQMETGGDLWRQVSREMGVSVVFG